MEALLVIFSYLLGSVPSGLIIGKLSGLDVRKAGSGNIGATNVARLLGKKVGLLTLVADTAKGLIPILLAQEIGLSDPISALVGIAAFLGHGTQLKYSQAFTPETGSAVTFTSLVFH